jgi:DNA repair protein RadA/Sms
LVKIREKLKFVCQECGYESLKWLGRCPSCSNYNTFVEEIVQTQKKKLSFHSREKPIPINEIILKKEERFSLSFGEFNRVLGGGIVPGSLILIGGDPGIGKSTLLLQISQDFAKNWGKVLYVSAEESINQVKLRGERMGITSEKIYILSEINLENILEEIKNIEPSLVVIDSIQTIFSEDVSSTSGSVTQVRECTIKLHSVAKSKGIPIFIIGHVTKEGLLAGPKVLEHIVDTVLYLEGEKNLNFRIIRAVKNRFGATDELAVFEMRENGLKEIPNPSEIFLGERLEDKIGSIVVPTVEGTRPILLELQALVSPAGIGIPRRQTIGVDYNRIVLILAVLEKIVGFHLSSQDVYVNLVGGVKAQEPALDLPVAIAIASSFKEIPVDSKTIAFGEIGLNGEVRMTSHANRRIKEAEKLGFKRFIVPYSNFGDLEKLNNRLEIQAVKTVREAISIALKK